MEPLSRAVPPMPADGYTDADEAAFARCEHLLLSTYRMSETGHREDRYPLFTDDTVVHIDYDPGLGDELVVSGKSDVVAWYDRSYQARVARGGGPRVHLCSNLMWSRLASDEIQSNNYMAYHEYPSDASSRVNAGPDLLADCVHRFRCVDGRWLMSHKYYWVFFSAVTVAR